MIKVTNGTSDIPFAYVRFVRAGNTVYIADHEDLYHEDVVEHFKLDPVTLEDAGFLEKDENSIYVNGYSRTFKLGVSLGDDDTPERLLTKKILKG